MIGETLAHFRVVDKLGEGGMGEVYRAEDTKLGRQVAVKLLPEAFARDSERMVRFAREAQVLASLNHPNIAGIYSVEEARRDTPAGELRFLVMELVEGETLEECIRRGPLQLDEALTIALQIAIALEEAHERGIIHRDLKPANIKLTPSNQVKLLDFGLAKALDPDPATDSRSSGPAARGPSLSPTLTVQSTQTGMLLGTAAYMSPEQARGAPADRRADIWALGVVLMEMLTGKVVHRGKTVSDTLASVLARDPAWGDLPPDTPRPIRRLLERCLEKEVRDRLRDVGEARIAIERYRAAPEAEEAAGPPRDLAAPPLWRRTLPWIVTGATAVALVATLWTLWPRVRTPDRPLRLGLTLPAERHLFSGYGSSAVLSPDGSRIAYVFARGNHYEIHTQSLDQWEGTLLHGSASNLRPYQPFFSPDGDWIGFVSPGEMRKVPVGGGTPIKLCDVALNRGASWGADKMIVLAPSPNSGLFTVPDAGGELTALTELEEGEVTHRWPQWLDDGRAVLFTSHTKSSDFDEANIELVILDSGERRVVHRGGTYGRYVASGHLVYANGGTLFAMPFDPDRLEATGSAAPVIEGVKTSPNEGSAQYSVSPDGKLAYVSGRAGAVGHSVVWLDRQGATEVLWDDEQIYRNPRFSPDGTRLAVEIDVEGQSDVWIYDIERDVPTRLTFSEADDSSAHWSPDGEYLYFSSTRDGVANLYRKLADGSGEAERLSESVNLQFSSSVSPDGRLLAFNEQVEGGNWDLYFLPLEEGAEPEPFVVSPFLEAIPRFSPNGRWVAYVSNESETFEVYVRPVSGRGKWQISSGGGSWPVWSRDGTELFYWFGSELHVAEVDTEADTFRAGRSRRLLEAQVADIGVSNPSDISPDGERFVIFHSPAAASPDSHDHIRLVLNWFEELERTFGGER